MPFKNGIQATQEIEAIYGRINTQNPRSLIPPKIIFLTAFKTPSFVSYIKQFGVTECYEKPIELELLCSAIQRVIDN
jgi:DNA-binding NarL/FixJ family response regulator